MNWKMTKPLINEMAAFFRLPAREVLALLSAEEKQHLLDSRPRARRRTIIGRAQVQL